MIEDQEPPEDLEAAMASGDRTRMGKAFERFFPDGAALVINQGDAVGIAGHVPGGHPQALGLLLGALDMIVKGMGLSLTLNIEPKKPGLVTAHELPKLSRMPGDPRWPPH